MSLAVQDLLDSPDLPLKLDAARKVLDLEAGLRRRFRDEILPHQKGEFINGRTIMHSPCRDSHNHVSSLITGILSPFVRLHGFGIIRCEKALCAFSRNDYEPDIAWFSAEKAAAIRPETMIYPVPDFIIEILSPSTEATDRGLKREHYAAHHVREYWVIDPESRVIEQHVLPDGADAYPHPTVHTGGEIRPASFPGLAVPHAACFDDTANLEFLRTLLT